MTIQCVSFLLSTGDVITDLASVGPPDSPLRRTIGQYDTGQVDMYLDGAPINWGAATTPGEAALAWYDDDDSSLAPQWGGFIVSRTRPLRGGIATLSLATFEAYFDRRIVGDQSYAAVGQNDILKSLVFNFAGDQGRYPGVPFQYDCEDGDGVPGLLRDRDYLDEDNATLYNRMRQLSSVDKGPEWTVDLKWDDTGTKILPHCRYGARIGSSPPAGRTPEGVFDEGTIVAGDYLESYADGDGANVVQAYSSGQAASVGSAAPNSGPVLGDLGNRPAFEYRYQPSSSITDVQLLKDYATRAVAFLGQGLNTLTLICHLNAQTRYGGTWKLGDDVHGLLDSCDTFPLGIDVVGRAIAYETDFAQNRITPIMAINAIPTDSSDS